MCVWLIYWLIECCLLYICLVFSYDDKIYGSVTRNMCDNECIFYLDWLLVGVYVCKYFATKYNSVQNINEFE